MDFSHDGLIMYTINKTMSSWHLDYKKNNQKILLHSTHKLKHC